MSSDHRRSERIIDFLPLEVHMVDKEDDHIIAGPFSGRIIDISAHGACLLMTQVMHNTFHVFHSTRTTKNAVLRLHTIDQTSGIAQYALIARPIWLDVFQQLEIRAFRMGVEFMENPDGKQMQEIREALRNNQEQRGHWWQEHCQTVRKKQ